MRIQDNQKHTNRGTYTKGQERADAIIRAAEYVLIEEGHQHFSMRQVAKVANLTLGNLQYYYPTKQHLLKALWEKVFSNYYRELVTLSKSIDGGPKAQLIALLGHMIRKLNGKQTSRFITEMWALSNHDEYAAQLTYEKYARFRQVISRYIKAINPTLNNAQVNKLALYISASLEGLSPFIGYGKPLIEETDSLVSISLQGFIWLIEKGEIPN